MTPTPPSRPEPPKRPNQPKTSASEQQSWPTDASSTTQTSQSVQGWQPYQLDHWAQQLVIQYRDEEGVLGESHKMRMACAYGLERFWGEHLRFQSSRNNKEKAKGDYWQAAWTTVAKILAAAGIQLPDAQGRVHLNERQKIENTAKAIWSLDPDDQRVALMVLTQFCDSLVWWTQRYKIKDSEAE
jgi:hypothetical protein